MLIRYNHFILSILLFSVILFSSCEECQDCEPEISQPQINATFIHQSEWSNLQEDVSGLSSIAGLYNDSIRVSSSYFNFLDDSLNQVQVGIDTGNTSLEPLFTLLSDKLDSTELEISKFSEELDLLQDDISEIQSVQNTILNGNLLVSKITNQSNNQSITFSDSSSSWILPYDLNSNSITYEFIIDSEVFEALMTYEKEEDLNYRRQVILSISNLSIERFENFDSVNVNANQVTFYF